MHSTAKLDHLTNRFVVVRRGAGLAANARLRVTVDGPAYGTGPEATVLVIRKSGAASSRIVALNTAGDGAVTVVFDSTVSRVVVVTTNASTRYRDCFGINAVRLLRGRAARPEHDLRFQAEVV